MACSLIFATIWLGMGCTKANHKMCSTLSKLSHRNSHPFFGSQLWQKFRERWDPAEVQ